MPGYCSRCGKEKTTYSKYCAECLRKGREARFRKRGYPELCEDKACVLAAKEE